MFIERGLTILAFKKSTLGLNLADRISLDLKRLKTSGKLFLWF